MNSLGEKITREYNEKVEYQEVLQKVQRLFAAEGPQKVEKDAAAQVRPDRSPVGQADTARPLLNAEAGRGATAPDKDMRFSFLAGVVNEEDRPRFERMLFRADQG
ncbi:hypothetical protein NSK_006770 [Nannochloropsis salina CCMP1776]|uniref:Uncharacterized protein n=1 Tax=Nannochloropsis salina CCMP1776 TaxID=1027361 RepID=A0A4D9CXC8_9STRA|nr:hypothetical protein NSK_006770 [Nannochloropsis salina CCMP1776]|eukprot:TFJ82105.1 hypothetical protein NSK_006770 [Nannochloropsis salina CCMP1776]